MFSIFKPRYRKDGELYIKGAEKKLAYSRDIWTAEMGTEFSGYIKELKAALKARDREAVEGAERKLDGFCKTHCPLPQTAWISENVEVILVAIIVALGIRTYFIQPFTIPTSSMSPTLKGITGKRTKEEPPNAAMQALDFALYGRSWHNVTALDDETIVSVRSEVRGGYRRFFDYTRIETDKKNVYWVNAQQQPVEETFGTPLGSGGRMYGMSFKKGEPIARGYTDTGDHVFVDKFSYHFRKPTRGEVIVFLTQNIEALGNAGPPPRQPSQFYIKRLGGVPGDELQIGPPVLFVNGKPAEEPGFKRVMEGTYANPVNGGYRGYGLRPSDARFLVHPGDTYKVGERRFFPLGDNSYNSKDGRWMGDVQQENLCGTGFLVYWPFFRDEGSHFGLIR